MQSSSLTPVAVNVSVFPEQIGFGEAPAVGVPVFGLPINWYKLAVKYNLLRLSSTVVTTHSSC